MLCTDGLRTMPQALRKDQAKVLPFRRTGGCIWTSPLLRLPRRLDRNLIQRPNQNPIVDLTLPRSRTLDLRLRRPSFLKESLVLPLTLGLHRTGHPPPPPYRNLDMDPNMNTNHCLHLNRLYLTFFLPLLMPRRRPSIPPTVPYPFLHGPCAQVSSSQPHLAHHHLCLAARGSVLLNSALARLPW